MIVSLTRRERAANFLRRGLRIQVVTNVTDGIEDEV